MSENTVETIDALTDKIGENESPSLIDVQVNIGAYLNALEGRIFGDGAIDGHEMADADHCFKSVLGQVLALERFAADIPSTDPRYTAIQVLKDNLNKNYVKAYNIKERANKELEITKALKLRGREAQRNAAVERERDALESINNDSFLPMSKTINLSSQSLVGFALGAAGLSNVANALESNPLIKTKMDEISAVLTSPLAQLNAQMPDLLNSFVQNGNPLDLQNADKWANTLVGELGALNTVENMKTALSGNNVAFLANLAGMGKSGGLA